MSLSVNDSVPAVTPKPGYDLLKRALDIALVLPVLLLVFPLFLILAILIKTTSPGPVLFKQKRLGKGGREFWCYKFRTMVADAEEQLHQRADLREKFLEGYKLLHDPRVTRVGAFLRKTSLDETPQFLNVLLGDMSLIGPRPIVPPELSKYGVFAPKLLTVKPGLGGLWQACGRSNTSYRERIEFDMIYIDHRSFWLDIKLLILTALCVVRGRGAC